jgi:hypothetical protein
MVSSCGSSSSSGPAPAKPGSPAFAWAAAQAAQKKGDFTTVGKNLDRVIGSDNEFRVRARLWMLTLDAGLARGDMEWADALETGGKLARANQIAFKRLSTEARSAASQSALRFADNGHKLLAQVKDADFAVAFPVPPGEKEKPVELAKITKGLLPPEAELAHITDQMTKRGVLLSVARLMDAGGDVEKAKSALAGADAKVARTALLTWYAGEAVEMAELYGSKKLDHSGRARLLLEEAKTSLAGVEASPAKAKITKRIEEQLKKLGK